MNLTIMDCPKGFPPFPLTNPNSAVYSSSVREADSLIMIGIERLKVEFPFTSKSIGMATSSRSRAVAAE